MDNELTRRSLGGIWRSQPLDEFAITLEQILKMSRSYERKIRIRNLIEYAAGLFVIGFFGYHAWITNASMMRIAFMVMIAGAVYVVVQLYRHGEPSVPPAERAVLTWVEFHQRELARQRDLLLNSWRWYLGPMIPGLVALLIGAVVTNPEGARRHAWFVGTWACGTALVFAGVRRLHVRTAAKLERQIQELQAAAKEGERQ